MTNSKNSETGKAPSEEPVVKVNIPPRRRTASIEVELGNGQVLKAGVNKTAVRVSTRTRTGYTEWLTLPRDCGEIQRVINLLIATQGEIVAQDEYLSKSD